MLLDEEEELGQEEDEAYKTDSDVSDTEDEEAAKKPKSIPVDKRLVIDVDLALSPWANAREFYGQRRSAVEKEQKTLQSSTKALKSQEAKITQDLKGWKSS